MTSSSPKSRIRPFFRRLLLLFLLLLAAAALVVSQPVLAGKSRPSPMPADAVRLEKHVRFLAEDCHPRDHKHPENLGRAADYIQAEFAAAGGIVSVQAYTADHHEFRNVLAFFGPDTQERIVVGAHYDAFGGLPGADDNASGTAGLMELARQLGAAPPPLRVELVAWTLEEPPYFRSAQMGSKVHAESLRNAGVKVRAVLGLEMIGRFSDAKGSQTYPIKGLGLIYPRRGNFVAVVGRFNDIPLTRKVKRAMRGAGSLPVRSLNGPTGPTGIDLSDHASYWAAGYPAVMISDTAFFRNFDYHEAGDTPDKLDYPRLAKVVEQLNGAVQALAEEAPTD